MIKYILMFSIFLSACEADNIRACAYSCEKGGGKMDHWSPVTGRKCKTD